MRLPYGLLFVFSSNAIGVLITFAQWTQASLLTTSLIDHVKLLYIRHTYTFSLTHSLIHLHIEIGSCVIPQTKAMVTLFILYGCAFVNNTYTLFLYYNLRVYNPRILI